MPYRSLDTARTEYQLGIKATYYFRIVPESYNEEVIREIASLGHEIGLDAQIVAKKIIKIYEEIIAKK